MYYEEALQEVVTSNPNSTLEMLLVAFIACLGGDILRTPSYSTLAIVGLMEVL